MGGEAHPVDCPAMTLLAAGGQVTYQVPKQSVSTSLTDP